MGNLNRCTFIGNLCADPELKATPSGKMVCNLRLAVNETWKDSNGQKQEKVEYIRITVWGDMGENCAKYLAKGRSVYVEGKLQTRSYDKDGVKHYATDVVASNVVFLGGGESKGEAREKPAGAPVAGTAPNAGDDEIPF